MEKKLINLYPADHWQISTPLGNGTLGASVYGAVYDERILINHEALYNWTCKSAYPDVSHALKEVRDLMDQKRYKEADTYYTDLIKATGFKSNKGKFFPAFDLHLLFETEGAPCDYKRELDMEKGVCTVSYTENGVKCTRTVFSSYTDGYVVVNLKKEASFSVKATLERHDMSDYVDNWYADEFKSVAVDSYIYSESKTAGGLHFSGIVKVLDTDGEIVSGKADKALKLDMTGSVTLQNYMEVKNATEITLILTVNEKVTPFEKMRDEIDNCTLSYSRLYKNHTDAFSKVFNATKLTIAKGENLSTEELLLKGYSGNIDTRLTQKMADFGRYLLISASSNCKYPANLQGLWNGAYSPAWACTF
ncbi:MAG: glycoside hydrolase family 95 protein, partial [Clostridia bacterium]|nr:glycoside hydrolase family 95 protein [Clostridia bacterium]